MTDNTEFGDGSQYGFVRFYDLTINPAQPPRIGQEQLAEAYSGIPGRVAVSGNYAYVSTVEAGLQVVDIAASKNFDPTNPGASIVGTFDTVGQGYQQPLDIIVYQGGRAVLTTTSGILLVLDVNQPQFPQLMMAYPGQPPLPAGSYTAWHADVAAQFPYTDQSGNNQVMDVAVTSGIDGRIYTVDLTNPYNPQRFGPVKNTDGTDLIIIATDIKISKTSGLVYLSPRQRRLRHRHQRPDKPEVFELHHANDHLDSWAVPARSWNRDGWVYLANAQMGMRVLDLDPVEIGISDNDTEFQDVVMPARDYYPALGTKAVTVWGIVTNEPLDDKWELRINGKPIPLVTFLLVGSSVPMANRLTGLQGHSGQCRVTEKDLLRSIFFGMAHPVSFGLITLRSNFKR